MKAAFDVEEEGFDEDQEDTSEGQLQAFIQHIKVRSGFRKLRQSIKKACRNLQSVMNAKLSKHRF